MLNYPIVIDAYSDLHLAVNGLDIENEIADLQYSLESSEIKPNILFFPGDLFDHLLLPNTKEYLAIVGFLIWVLKFCEKYNITLRVLEGTPSHDHKQCLIMDTLFEYIKPRIPYRYFTTMSVEVIEEYGISVLYIPDKFLPSHTDIYIAAKELMALHGFDKVDYIIMHGAFEDQLPANCGISTHNTDLYSELCNYYVLSGHIHKHFIRKKIVSVGSYTRMIHGEEEDKGYVRIVMKSEDDYTIKQVVNPNARPYITIDCLGLSLNEIMDKIDNASRAKSKSNFRLMIDDNPDIKKQLSFIKMNYPMHNWVMQYPKKRRAVQKDYILSTEEAVDLVLSKDNLRTHIENYYNSTKDKYNVELNEIQSYIESIM